MTHHYLCDACVGLFTSVSFLFEAVTPAWYPGSAFLFEISRVSNRGEKLRAERCTSGNFPCIFRLFVFQCVFCHPIYLCTVCMLDAGLRTHLVVRLLVYVMKEGHLCIFHSERFGPRLRPPLSSCQLTVRGPETNMIPTKNSNIISTCSTLLVYTELGLRDPQTA